eukprot:2092134-Alexandrium_andersonii.AAC.1
MPAPWRDGQLHSVPGPLQAGGRGGAHPAHHHPRCSPYPRRGASGGRSRLSCEPGRGRRSCPPAP